MNRAWRRARRWLLPALAPGDGGEVELLRELAAGRAQLWIGDQAAVVTQCVATAEGRSLHIWLAGGRLAGVLALREGVEAWARGQGCGAVTLEGRPGWARVLRPHGYAPQGRELRRSL
ncbi:hypothetical protein [Phenylobacterium sp.]|uniref:hypothetical protein n=1 Tax=Phenylobacterium sp. TaxID=1871053 RepID=UPI0019A52907|nr:hypothetical protein [Phenylobacterium sp.]MBC7168426.1 hypothetical protein [Phenylobacterium sp.]